MSDRVALVTGAAGGIGSAIAARLAREGFRVACSDLAAEDAERAAAEIAGARGFGCDLRSEAAVEGLRDAVTAELGAPWLLVNAAGVFFEHEVTELSLEQWDLVMDVNARGTFLTCRALLPAMQEARLGLHRQHRLDGRAERRSHARGLQRLEGRGRDVHAQPRDRLGAARRARQLRRARD